MIEVYPVEHKGEIWANLVDIVTISEAQLKARHNMRHGGHTYVWNDGIPGVRVYFAYEDGTSELRLARKMHIIFIYIQSIINMMRIEKSLPALSRNRL